MTTHYSIWIESTNKHKSEVSGEFAKTLERIEEVNTELEHTKKNNNKKFREIDTIEGLNEKKLIVLKTHSDDAKKFHDMISSKAERLDSRIVSFKGTLEGLIQTTKEEIQSKIDEVSHNFATKSDSLNSAINKTKTLWIDIIEMNKETLQGEVKDSLETSKVLVEGFRQELEGRLAEALEVTHQKVSKVKDIWAGYFEKYDQVNLTNERRFEKVNKTFQEWRDTVMKPLNNSEARLYAVETRLKQTENKMFQTFSHSRDVLKKLVFALEQESISQRDTLINKMMKKAEFNIDSNMGLHKSKDYGSMKNVRDKTLDFLFIKRLLFIKHEIDEYPKEVDEVFQPIESKKPKTPKSLLASRFGNKSNSMYAEYRPRVRTTTNKHRRHEFTSMSPLRLFNKKMPPKESKISLNIKKNMYSNSLVSSTDKSLAQISKAHINILKQRVAWLANHPNNHSNKILEPEFSEDELCEDSQFLTQQQKLADQQD
jgi:hypothetical protein